ncbi:hypothetical protein BDB13_6000 [Rhodococcus sp. OK302]|nr:hypothetical protein BDB13_6000 [Rhodococcus sp. OK302]
MLADSPDLAEVHAVPVGSYSLVEGVGDRIAVHFESGNPACFGALSSL